MATVTRKNGASGRLFGWGLRITCPGHIWNAKIREFIQKYELSNCVVCAEGPDSDCKHDHYHFYFNRNYTDVTIRQWVRDFFGITGNAAFALTQCDSKFECYLRYMCKGVEQGEMPVIVHDEYFAAGGVAEYHEAYWRENARLRAEKQKKRLQGGIRKEMTERAKEILKTCDNQPPSLDDIIGAVLDAETELDGPGMAFIRERVVDHLYCTHNNLSWRSNVQDKIRRRYV